MRLSKFYFLTLFIAFFIADFICAQEVVISEFMARNLTSIEDEDGDNSDWIELFNNSESAVNLDGWFLTDDFSLGKKWPIPPVNLSPSEYLIVFASNKDRRDPEGELHTNFKLTSGGEYLGLIRPDGVTVEHEFAPAFPPQIDDLSYGLGMGGSAGSEITLIEEGENVTYHVPLNGNDDVDDGDNTDSWIGLDFDDSFWTVAQTGIGYAERNPDHYDSEISDSGDVQSLMLDQRTSIYIRIPFTIDNPDTLGSLTLRMKYDDGFVAYLNGSAEAFAEANAPVSAVWNSIATAINDDGDALIFEDFTRTAGSLPLQVGENVLCIHGLNRSSGSSDLLFVPVLQASKLAVGALNGSINYFNISTPGSLNGDGSVDPGPIVRGVPETVARPVIGGGDDIVLVNSVSEFSGVQGQDGWLYGYYDRTADLNAGGDGVFDFASEFTEFAGGDGAGDWNGATQMWDGTQWIRGDSGSDTQTRLGAENVHPSDAAPGPEEYVIRRWVCDVAGAHRLVVNFHNHSVDGDGTTGRVFYNGTEIALLSTDGDFREVTEEVILEEGDVIDFMVDSGPNPGTDSDGADETLQTIQILEGWESGAFTNIPITAQVNPSVRPIASVELRYRVMFGSESTVAMVDDGTGGDQFAGDGIYTGVIATNQLDEGEMLRWRVVARDSDGNANTDPAYNDPLDSPEYWGTVAANSAEDSSLLTVLHWFVQNAGAADTSSGTRSSAYYLGEFYDNIQTDLHGQSSKHFPKKSYDFDFNAGNRFRWREGERRVKDLNLITNWSDKAKIRQTLAYDIVKRSGGFEHFCFPVRVQRNAEFFSVADMIEDGDDRWLERVGLDPNGSLYKMKNPVNSGTVDAEKKTRKWENNADLQDYVDGLLQGGDAKERFGIDNTNIPALINYAATTAIFSHTDNGNKNFLLYFDSDGSREWYLIEWDLDLSLGRKWIRHPTQQGHFNDDLFQERSLRHGSQNNLYSLIYNSSVLWELYNRRLRTLMDDMLGAPGTTDSYVFQKMDEHLALLDPPGVTSDADLDYANWGSWGDNHNMEQAMGRLRNEHFHDPGPATDLREYLEGEPSVPASQINEPDVRIGQVEYNPVVSGASSDQSGEFLTLENPNNFAVDISGWRVYGAVDYVLPAGSVIPSGSEANPGRVYLARDAVGFRARSLSPRANEKRIVIAGYDGQLSARGESVFLENTAATMIDSTTYEGEPTELQQYLRVSEIQYNPTNPTSAELLSDPTLSASDFEFIELTNIGDAAMDIGSASFTKGVLFTFAPGTMLGAGEAIIVVSKLTAFELRHGVGLNVAGEYVGRLNNKGESIQILDGAGESILSFSFKDGWYEPTDGNGFSLVMRNAKETLFNDWGEKARWGISKNIGGSPAVLSNEISLIAKAWENYNFTEEERADPAQSGPLADFDGDRIPNVMEYALGLNPKEVDQNGLPQFGVMRDEDSDFITLTLRRQKNALDLTYLVETSTNMVHWLPVSNQVGDSVDNGDGTETVTIRSNTPIDEGSNEFIRVRFVRL